MQVEHRWVSDIGMFAIDRPIFSIKAKGDRPAVKGSCVHKTKACDGCFNMKFHRMYPDAMDGRDVRNEHSWQRIDGLSLSKTLKRKRNQTSRVRLMTRGEAFRDRADVPRVRDLCEQNPDKIFWVPTRAWRNKHLRPLLLKLAEEVPNLRIQASTDIDTTLEEQQMLDEQGWSTLYFGDDEQRETLTGEPRHMCAKTWEKAKGACASTCKKGGCFDKEVTHVILKKH